MERVKEIKIKVITSNVAFPFIRKHHYSGKVVCNSCLHFGAFLDGHLHGVMSFGPSMDKRKTMGLVSGTGWNEFLELNRMAFDDYLPRNSESYCIGVAIRLIKKNAPHIKWIISFADGTQCGDGTIYRASNFVLTGIKENKQILEMPSGQHISELSIGSTGNSKAIQKECAFLGIPVSRYSIKQWREMGAKFIDGFQLRYIYFINKKCKDLLTVPILPFTKIDEMGAGMYKGKNISRAERHEKTTD